MISIVYPFYGTDISITMHLHHTRLPTQLHLAVHTRPFQLHVSASPPWLARDVNSLRYKDWTQNA